MSYLRRLDQPPTLVQASGNWVLLRERASSENQSAASGWSLTLWSAGSNPAFKQQELAVVGGGDTAVEEAMYLTKYGKKASSEYPHKTLKLQSALNVCFWQDTT